MSLTEAEIAEIVSRVMGELQTPTPTPSAVTLGHFSVAPGDTILADHINSLSDQAIPKFANAAARNTSWPTPPDGALCWLEDVNYLEIYSDSITSGTKTWHPVGGLRMGYATMGLNQSIPNNVVTLVKVETTGGAAGLAGRGTWYTDGSVGVPLAGTYLVSGNVTWPSKTAGERQVYIQKKTVAGVWTSSGTAGGLTEDVGSGAGVLRQSATAMVACAVGERVGLLVLQNSGAPMVLPNDGARLAVQLLGAD